VNGLRRRPGRPPDRARAVAYRPRQRSHRGRLQEDGPSDGDAPIRLYMSMFVDERPRGLVDPQCFGLPAGAVQGEHELAGRLFAVRMLGDQLAESESMDNRG
jgi:hypothetical protein